MTDFTSTTCSAVPGWGAADVLRAVQDLKVRAQANRLPFDCLVMHQATWAAVEGFFSAPRSEVDAAKFRLLGLGVWVAGSAFEAADRVKALVAAGKRPLLVASGKELTDALTDAALGDGVLP